MYIYDLLRFFSLLLPPSFLLLLPSFFLLLPPSSSFFLPLPSSFILHLTQLCAHVRWISPTTLECYYNTASNQAGETDIILKTSFLGYDEKWTADPRIYVSYSERGGKFYEEPSSIIPS